MMHEKPSVVEDRLNLWVPREKWDITSDEIISRMRRGQKNAIRWNMFPVAEILGVLQKASQEVQIPVSMLSRTEFIQPLEMLNQHSLAGLYIFASHHKERGKKGVIPFLFELIGVRATAEDVIAAMKKDRVIQWGQLSREVIKTLLEKVAQEQGKTVNALLQDDFKKPCVALGGRSLVSVYGHFAKHPDRKGRPTMIFLLENCGIEVTIYNKLRTTRQFLSKVSPDEIRELLIEAGKELGKPASMLTLADTAKHFRFLNGQTLGRWTRKVDGRRTRISLHKEVDIEATFNDVVETAKKGNLILWHRIPMEVIREILVKAADEVGIPVSSILEEDMNMKNHRFKFLGGITLAGLKTFTANLEGAPSRGKLSYFLDQLGIGVSADDVIAKIKGGRRVIWKSIDISWQEIRAVLDFVAEEMGIPVGMINYGSLSKKYTFLDGNTLQRLYFLGARHPEKTPEETVLMFIRRKTGIPEINISKSAFRFSMMNESFVSQNLSEGFKAEDLMPWIQSVAKLYENSFLNIQKEEIESEAVIFIYEAIGKGLSKDDIIKNLHEHLEGFLRKESRVRYQEKLLSTPIADGFTLQDVIASKDPGLGLEEEGLSGRLLRSLRILTPFQQKLVISIAVDGKNLDELTEELGLDRDTLEEHYTDALTLLRNSMEPEEDE